MKMIKNSFFLCSLIFLMFSCSKDSKKNSVYVKDIIELNDAIASAKPGDEIVMANGQWKDVEINFRGKGTKNNPITLTAETAGKVTIEGLSYLKFGGEFLVVEGLHFKNGFSPSNAVIDFKIANKEGADEISNNCKVTNCVMAHG